MQVAWQKRHTNNPGPCDLSCVDPSKNILIFHAKNNVNFQKQANSPGDRAGWLSVNLHPTSYMYSRESSELSLDVPYPSEPSALDLVN